MKAPRGLDKPLFHKARLDRNPDKMRVRRIGRFRG
jgi:hypothetical protein